MIVCTRRLLEKYTQYEQQVAELQAREGGGEEEEIEEVLTPDEKDKAQKVKKTIEK